MLELAATYIKIQPVGENNNGLYRTQRLEYAE
jgi:hypothetical protein